MAAIDAIGIEARRVLLDVMMAVAWADRSLAPEEAEAARAAALSMGLVLPADHEHTSALRRPVRPEEIPLGGLTSRDRELVYLCAAWMALADAVEDAEEAQMLGALRAHLGLDMARAGWLRARAAELRASQSSTPSTWWRAFDRLVVEAARALQKGVA